MYTIVVFRWSNYYLYVSSLGTWPYRRTLEGGLVSQFIVLSVVFHPRDSGHSVEGSRSTFSFWRLTWCGVTPFLYLLRRSDVNSVLVTRAARIFYIVTTTTTSVHWVQTESRSLKDITNRRLLTRPFTELGRYGVKGVNYSLLIIRVSTILPIYSIMYYFSILVTDGV